MSQKVLVAGTGISGIAAAKLLLAQGGEVVLYDGNEKLSAEDLKAKFDEGAKVSVILGELKKLDLTGVELAVISPGISLEAPFVAVIDEAKIPIWSEIELAYHCTKGKIAAITGAVVGSLLGFLLFNVYPAKVFMGDTGSLALGGFVASSAFMMQMPLFIAIVGIIYLVEVLSVIIQVTYFKKTGGKRIFKMAPIHHHFELCGWSETRVVAVFSIVTAILCLIAYLGL